MMTKELAGIFVRVEPYAIRRASLNPEGGPTLWFSTVHNDQDQNNPPDSRFCYCRKKDADVSWKRLDHIIISIYLHGMNTKLPAGARRRPRLCLFVLSACNETIYVHCFLPLRLRMCPLESTKLMAARLS